MKELAILVTFALNDFDADFRIFFFENLECGITYCLFFRFESAVEKENISAFSDNHIIFYVRDDGLFENSLFVLKSYLDEYLASNFEIVKPDSVELLIVSFGPV